MAPPKDDGFKWFGEGFDGFPKRLPEDSVEYVFHIVEPAISDASLRDRFRKVQAAANALTKTLLKEYIWQREQFSLELVREDGRSFLRGRTNYGDSVEDEWLIVYLLRDLSRQFHDVWIRVIDTDGEFLLIEAANALPKWLNPEVAENRVWLNQGQLLLIPPFESTKGRKPIQQNTGSLSLPEAIAVLSSDRAKLLHARIIEEEAFYRLRNYPQQIEDNLHHALITIPRRLAYILHASPAYISPAVEAFYLRDPIAIRPLRDPTNMSLLFPPEDFVTSRVRFTKVGYAQLKSQVFSAPAVWARSLSPNSGSKARERAELGMKVACGFEMLVSDPQNQDKKAVREIKLLFEDLEGGDDQLPTNEQIKLWGTEEDDESWLDIDFNDLEAELAGKHGSSTAGAGAKPEFGDKAAQENLRKMVSRFEEFMNEDDLEDMDDDDDGDEDSSRNGSTVSEEDADDDGEDKAASFDENEFTAMMREMMGMPIDVMDEMMGPFSAKAHGIAHDDGATKITTEDKVAHHNQQSGPKTSPTRPCFGPERPPHLKNPGHSSAPISSKGKQKATTSDPDVEEIDRDFTEEASDQDSDDEDEIRALSAAMEVELKRAGALSLNDVDVTGSSSKSKQNASGKKPVVKKARFQASAEDYVDKLEDCEEEHGESEPEMLDSDYNLVQNMLESFKSQAGMAGPGGNMMGMMGMKMPRDEEEP